MLRAIVRASLQQPFLVLAVAAALLVVGYRNLANAPLDVFPEFAPPLVEIQTELKMAEDALLKAFFLLRPKKKAVFKSFWEKPCVSIRKQVFEEPRPRLEKPWGMTRF